MPTHSGLPRLTLYHTSGCHLCEAAEGLVMAVLAAKNLPLDCLKRVDIADDNALLKRYGVVIPVLRQEDSAQELNWPFGPDDIQRLVPGRLELDGSGQ